MARTQVMSIPDFVRNGWQEERTIDVFFTHLERHKIKYRIIGTTIIIFLCLDVTAFASTGIDEGANKLYKKVLNVAKWVLIVKGGIDTIKSATDGDLPAAKKNFLGYAVTYLMLLGLPWSFDQIGKLFDEVEASSP